MLKNSIKLLIFIFGFTLVSSSVYAQEKMNPDVLIDSIDIEQYAPQTQSSLSISPAIIELILEPGNATEKTIYIINGSRFPLPIKGTVQNFTINEKVLEPKGKVNDDVFNASSWFKLEPSDFIIQPGEEKEIKVFIDTPKNAEPGGHYATIFFQPLIPQEFVSNTSTQLTTKVGALVLAIVKGDIIEEATLGTLETKSLYRTGPIAFNIPVFNSGNIHILPSGKLYLKNSKDETIKEFPLAPSTVLPHTQRTFPVVWDQKYIFGKYSAVAEIKFGSNNAELVSNKVTFWVIPWIRISLIVLLLTGAIVFFKLTYRNFNKAIRVLIGQEQ